MVELLIKAIDANHNDPIKDKAGCYKEGDIVEVREDNAKYGRMECLPKFFIFKMTGLLKKDYLYLVESETEEGFDKDNIPTVEVKTRRKYKFPFKEVFTKEKLDKIKDSNWLVEEIDKTKIIDKTKL